MKKTTTKKTVKKLSKKERMKKMLAAAKRRYAKFKKMTAAQKRVQICKDALMHLDAKYLISKPGNYVIPAKSQMDIKEVGIRGNRHARSMENDADLRETLEGFSHCGVCAKGALFISAVLLRNTATCELIMDDGDPTVGGGLKEFSRKDLSLIEGLYEGNIYSGRFHGAAEWKKVHWDADKRLRMICENIIKYKGTFKPEKLPRMKFCIERESII